MWFFIYLNAEPSQIKVFADQNKVLKKRPYDSLLERMCMLNFETVLRYFYQNVLNYHFPSW